MVSKHVFDSSYIFYKKLLFKMNDTCDDNIKAISKQFLCCVPVQKISWMNIFNDLATDYNLQETFLKSTVNSVLNSEYPIKINYQICFLKEVISKLEKQHAEIHDDVYTAYGRLMALPNQEEYFYKHYSINDCNQISLKESPSLISEGTTGLRTWQASLALCQWVLNNKELFNQKIILELGSGVGLAGMVIVKECEAKAIYLTDCHLSVLKLLCENIKINIEGESNVNNSTLEKRCLYNNLGPPRLSVLNLPWEEIDEAVCNSLGSVDTIIAADVVYDKDLFGYLIGALKRLSHFCKVGNILFSCTERNPETLKLFQEKIGEAGFRMKETSTPKPNIFYWPENDPVKIFYIIK